MRYFHSTVLAIACLVAMIGNSSAHADERCFMIMFTSQAKPVKATTSHSFVTLIRAKGESNTDVRDWQLEEYTISWLPATGVLHSFRRPEPGHNFRSREKIQWAERNGAQVTMWGPFEVDPDLLVFAQRQIESLESGQVAYRMLDSLTRPRAVNCIHAVSDMVPGEPLASGTAFGEPASKILLGHLRRWILDPDETHDWLLNHTGLAKHPIQRQSFPK